AVVNISTRQRVKVQGNPLAQLFGMPDGGPQTREAQSLGSGFIISADGYVVTNNHVITADGKGEVESITVTTPDGTEYPAKLIGRDAASDLAVLKIARTKPFPFVQFGNSAQARVGDWVIAIGNPFGLGGTVTQGIISAVYRNTGEGGAYDRYLQTDASINRGNSGGPMFDMRGQVIGINRAIFSPSGGSIGIGFAIPAETAAPIVQKLMKGQSIDRGYLGVRIQQLNDDLADSLGIAHNRGEFIQAVEPGGAADKAGLQAGDVILKVNGQDVTPDQTLSYLVANIAPGSRVTIDLIRDGKPRTVTATVSKRPSEEELAQQQMFDPDADAMDQNGSASEGAIEESLGLQVIPLTPQIARQLGAPDDTQGVVIAGVDPSSDAAAKGLQRGDIVLTANYKAIASPGDLEQAISSAKSSGREAILLRIQRRGRPATYVPIRLR
ncbi:MAG: Do family serine endopeptidase, partial [Novosphingobium sp.]|nr:Do family serine endopeptidase [Novosphingobium sp.]